VENGHVDYLGWSFNIGHSPIAGVKLYNVRYRGCVVCRVCLGVGSAVVVLLFMCNSCWKACCHTANNGGALIFGSMCGISPCGVIESVHMCYLSDQVAYEIGLSEAIAVYSGVNDIVQAATVYGDTAWGLGSSVNEQVSDTAVFMWSVRSVYALCLSR
jgi:hypothetical protein